MNAPVVAKRISMELTLDRDEYGTWTYHISRLGRPGLGGDEYQSVIPMCADLREALEQIAQGRA